MAFLMVQDQQLEKMKTMWLISKYSVWNFYTRGNYLKIRGFESEHGWMFAVYVLKCRFMHDSKGEDWLFFQGSGLRPYAFNVNEKTTIFEKTEALVETSDELIRKYVDMASRKVSPEAAENAGVKLDLMLSLRGLSGSAASVRDLVGVECLECPVAAN